MKTAIIYVSSHHGNTKKVIDEMATVKEIDLLFTVYTCGINYINYARGIQKIIKAQNCDFVGGFSCRGYDTFGFFEKIGGIAKGHPNEKDFKKAREFIKNI